MQKILLIIHHPKLSPCSSHTASTPEPFSQLHSKLA